MSKIYTLHREDTIQTTIDDAWAFMSRPENLDRITPEDMGFTIVTDVPEQMHNGLLVEYRIRIPFLGNQTWLSEINHIVPDRSFVDVQIIGPYKYWHHYHSIEESDGGVKFVDHVTYQVPCGIFGQLAHSLFIRRILDRIFSYRAEIFREVFEPSKQEK